MFYSHTEKNVSSPLLKYSSAFLGRAFSGKQHFREASVCVPVKSLVCLMLALL